MNCRPHGRKPTLALWMLVALADVALLVATAGALTVLLVAAGAVTLGAAVLAARMLIRRESATARAVPVAVPATRSRTLRETRLR